MIFVSHTSADRKFVERLVSDLSAWGFDLWVSTWEIRAGESITEKVQAGLRESDCLIVVLSRASCKARWVRQEVNSYLFRQISKRKGRVIPVMVEECVPSFFLRDRLQIRFHRDGYNDAFVTLAFQLLEMSTGTPASPAVDVFRRRKVPVQTVKQFLRRYNEITHDPSHVAPDYIIVRDERWIRVAKNRDVRVTVSLDILLCKGKWDDTWRDTVFDSSKRHSLRSIAYKTNSRIIRHTYDRKVSSVVVRWRPKRTIRSGQIYRHKYSWGVPKGFPNPTEYWVHRRYSYPTLWTEIHVECAGSVDSLLPCRAPFTFEFIEPWEFIAYAHRSRDTFSKIESRPRRLTLGLEAKEVAEGVMIALLFPGWKQYHEQARTRGSKARRRGFEQQWLVECEFRKALGWGPIPIANINQAVRRSG